MNTVVSNMEESQLEACKDKLNELEMSFNEKLENSANKEDFIKIVGSHYLNSE